MDHKAWPWRKKSSEKTILVPEEVDLSSKGTEGKTHLMDKTAELERSVKDLNEKLTSAISDSSSKDALVAKHAKVAEEAIAGWEKAEAEAIFFKKELEDALRLRLATEDRVLHLDSALKECMHQLRFVQEQQEKRIDEAIMRTSREFDKERFNLEEKLADTNKRTSKLDHENSHLIKSLQIKDKVIEELRQQKFQVEADFNALVARMDSTEKLNSSLKYEVCVLEKELEVRNEDKEFNRRAADASHRQHLESMKKIAKLETECQRLRLLVRKRLPGPAALAKMRNEVESLGRDANETRRKKLNHVMGSLDDSYDKRISFLIERVSAIEEENKILKESLTKKNGELQSSRVISARAASKLSQLEAQLSDLGKNETSLELVSAIEPLSSVSTLVSMSEEDEFSCAESWASALMSELENFRNGKSKVQSCVSVGVSDLSLMDDFVEMEKLALVSEEEPVSSTRASLDESNKTVLLLETDSKSYPSEATGKELVAITEERQDPIENAPNWIQDILMIISQQSSVTQRSHEEIFEEVRVACKNHTVPGDVTNSSRDPACISGYLTWKNEHTSPTKNSYDGADSPNLSLVGISNQNINSNLNKAISKIVELIEGINNQQLLSKNNGNSTAYMVRVFQWKCSELSGVLHNFVHICYQLLQGKADIENFAEELSSTLNWIMNHCFSLQDVSSMKDSIKKHFSWDEPYSEGEVELEEVKDIFPHTDESSELKLKAENRRLKDAIKSMELGRRVLEERLLTTTDKNESLMSKLHESEQSVTNLEEELAFLKESKPLIEDQMENYKLLSEDLDTQLKVARVEMSKARQEFSSLEVELEDKSNCCEELEATCLELQLQLESVSNKESSDYNVDQEEKQVRTNWEISAASEKLAECQETILNLGKQLKALASPRDAALIDKVITSTSPVKSNHRASLLDKMLAEDDDKADEEIKSPKTKEIICTSDPQKSRKASVGLLYGSTISMNDIGRDSKMLPGSFYSANNNGYKMETRVGSLAIVPKRNKGAGAFLKKLLMRKKRESNKKAVLAITAK